jgi:ribonuclease M5
LNLETIDVLKIKEIIVVEGRDDERAVKQAVDAEIIVTSGFGITRETYRKIELASRRKGVIVFTDPDFAGEQIRRKINEKIKGCKNAFLTHEDARKKDNVGVENASPASIIQALQKAKCSLEDIPEVFTTEMLCHFGLIGGKDAASRREKIGKILGVGYANGKQLARRLNRYAVTPEQFENAMVQLSTSLDAS